MKDLTALGLEWAHHSPLTYFSTRHELLLYLEGLMRKTDEGRDCWPRTLREIVGSDDVPQDEPLDTAWARRALMITGNALGYRIKLIANGVLVVVFPGLR